VITKAYRFNDKQAIEFGLKDLFGDKYTLVTYFRMYSELTGSITKIQPRHASTVPDETFDVDKSVSAMEA
jgi:predicted dithiol-disulfide oxidoreductase (DUF899 family)